MISAIYVYGGNPINRSASSVLGRSYTKFKRHKRKKQSKYGLVAKKIAPELIGKISRYVGIKK
jgi:hypothetical protein